MRAPGRKNDTCKGPEAGMTLNSKELKAQDDWRGVSKLRARSKNGLR